MDAAVIDQHRLAVFHFGHRCVHVAPHESIHIAHSGSGLFVGEPYLCIDAEVIYPVQNDAVSLGDVRYTGADTFKRISRAVRGAHLAYYLWLAIHNLGSAVLLNLGGQVIANIDMRDEIGRAQTVDSADADLGEEVLTLWFINA